MRNNHKRSKSKFLAFCLSVMMVSSAAAFASCSKKTTVDNSSDSTTDTETESTLSDPNLLIKNGGFETFNTNKGLNAIGTSVSGWTLTKNTSSSGTADTSQAASGIINLEEKAWDKLTGENPEYNVETLTVEEAEAAWDKLTVKQKLAFYDKWKKDNPDGTISKDLSFYEAFNIESKDIPKVDAFQTHHTDAEKAAIAEETGKDFDDYNVLMLHNQNPKEADSNEEKWKGTAYKFTSSSTVTIPAGASAQFSVWVRTEDLRAPFDQNVGQPAVGVGAYISVTNSVGGRTLDRYEVKNINTELMDQASLVNEWAKYTFYIKGSSYTQTTFSVVLGLGQGGGSDNFEYVNGYAFFDDIQCEIIENDVLEAGLSAAGIVRNDTNPEQDEIARFTDTKEGKKTVDAYQEASRNTFAIDYFGGFDAADDVFDNASFGTTKSEINGVEYDSLASDKGGNPYMNLNNGGFSNEGDVTKVFDNFNAIKTEAGYGDNVDADGNPVNTNNSDLWEIYEEHFLDTKFGENDPVLMLLSTNGVAYTAESGYSFQFSKDVQYMAISVFVKTSNMYGFTGAGITLTDSANTDNKASISAIDTTNITPVKIGDNEDYYEGWQQCFFFVENTSKDENAKFDISFTFGPTAIDGTTVSSYHYGFAAFSQISCYPMTLQEYDSVSASTYAKLFNVTGQQPDLGSGNSGFDTPTATKNAIEKGIADPSTYKGVYADSAYITMSGNDATINKHLNAGLINKKHFTDTEEGYYATATGAWIDGIKGVAGSGATAVEAWNTVIGEESTQPILIWNGADKQVLDADGKPVLDSNNNPTYVYSNKPYGYIGNTTTIASGNTVVISTRVKVSADAVAYVYLMDMSDDNYNEVLSIGRNLTYWYDNDGNVRSEDPSEATSEIVLRLQKNGLYKVNTKWSGYKSLTAEQKADLDSKVFANLANYGTDSEGNLVVAEGGASHAYSDYWNNEGEDGIAFYKSGESYYADRACTVEVTPFTALNGLNARYEAIEGSNEKQLFQKVENTNGEWATVSFYIRAGSQTKSYRLEVWSGARDGSEVSAENSYVLFDANPGLASSAQTHFDNLMTAWEKDDTLDKFENVFSYYDSNTYLRYNADLDENGVGNVYDSYKAESKTSGIAYIEKDEDLRYTTLVDFSYNDEKVTASTDTDTDDDTTESEDGGEETNAWLLASSLILAGVLLLAIVSLIIRKVIKKRRRNAAVVAKPKKVKVKKAKKAKASKKVETEEIDEDSPYND
ncbi:MAG: hypothetical protein E7364_00620 [Clostridiales bacterium]|nr:hypothetical protein [Clostridiales bacterium]